MPLTFATLQTILPFAASAAAVALIETLLTQQLLDELTGARTSTHVECMGQGFAQARPIPPIPGKQKVRVLPAATHTEPLSRRRRSARHACRLRRGSRAAWAAAQW